MTEKGQLMTDKWQFAIIDTENKSLRKGICGIYEDLPTMYNQVKKILEQENDSQKVIAHMPSSKKLTVLMPIKKFAQIMTSARDNPNKDDLKMIVTESRNQEFIRAFLREIISPRTKPSEDELEHRRKILELCIEVFEEEGEDMQLNAMFCKIALI